jgi:hypothetical protein
MKIEYPRRVKTMRLDVPRYVKLTVKVIQFFFNLMEGRK